MTSDDVASSAGYPTPHDNTCDRCGHEWRSRGTPVSCPECGADMPDQGTCIDLFDRARGKDATPVGEDTIADLDREIDRRLHGGDGSGLFDDVLEPGNDDYYKDRRSHSYAGEHEESKFRGRYWRVQRRKAIERDRNRCQSCGVSRPHYQEFRGYDLDVHHITPEDEFDSQLDAHALENLITLCKTCHSECEGMGIEELIRRTDHHDWLDSHE